MNSPAAKGKDAIGDSGCRDGGDDPQRMAAAAGRRQSWTMVMAECRDFHVERIVRDDEQWRVRKNWEPK